MIGGSKHMEYIGIGVVIAVAIAAVVIAADVLTTEVMFCCSCC